MTTYSSPEVIVKNNEVFLTPAKAHIRSIIIPHITKRNVVLNHSDAGKRYFLNATGTFSAYTNRRISLIRHNLLSPFSFPLSEDQIVDQAMQQAIDSLNRVKLAMKTSVQSMLHEIEENYNIEK